MKKLYCQQNKSHESRKPILMEATHPGLPANMIDVSSAEGVYYTAYECPECGTFIVMEDN